MTKTPKLKDGLYKFKDSPRIDIINDSKLDLWDHTTENMWKSWQGETGFARVERILEGSKPSLVLPIEYLT